MSYIKHSLGDIISQSLRAAYGIGEQADTVTNYHDGIVHVRVRDVYGTRRVYPLCPTGKLLAKLAGTETFTPQAIGLIRDLGYTFSVEQEQLP